MTSHENQTITKFQMVIPHSDILTQNHSKTRTGHTKTFRQLPCKNDSFKFSFFCSTLQDWSKTIVARDI